VGGHKALNGEQLAGIHLIIGEEPKTELILSDSHAFSLRHHTLKCISLLFYKAKKIDITVMMETGLETKQR
jgi:hypothetical protein